MEQEVSINSAEFEFTATRAQGPGGQHVNKTSTRIVLRFNVQESTSLSNEHKQLILSRLSTRIDKEGFLSVSVQESRSQAFNKELAVTRLLELIRSALVVQKKRKKTRVPRSAQLKRLDSKKRRGDIKRTRQNTDD
jgi:ribosome-associated protein